MAINAKLRFTLLTSLCLGLCSTVLRSQDGYPAVIDSTTIHHKVLCGYQGFFGCRGDGSNQGWSHWFNSEPLKGKPAPIHVEYWPDMSEMTPEERYAAPGYTYPDGKPAALFSAHNPLTVLRHFQWMRQYGIDGVFLQRFLLNLPGSIEANTFQERFDVMNNVRAAALQTGRVWAINYDTCGISTDKIFDVLTTDWKRLVDWKITDDPRYLHEGGAPVVHIWWNMADLTMTPEVLNQLIAFFKAPGPYHAYIAAGGGHDWRTKPEIQWRASTSGLNIMTNPNAGGKDNVAKKKWIDAIERLDALVPWNAANSRVDKNGVRHAAMDEWAGDREELSKHGVLWIPVVYPAFSWNNNQGLPLGTDGFSGRKGNFLWEQFHALSQIGGVDTIFLAFFDELDEGTQIMKVTNTPPTQGHFLTYEGMPSDWYMRLTGLGEKMLRDKTPIPAEIPIKP